MRFTMEFLIIENTDVEENSIEFANSSCKM